MPKSIYYEWLRYLDKKREKRNNFLDKIIKSIFDEHYGRYGSRRILIELKSKGISCTRAKVAERMKTLNLVAKAAKKFKATTNSNHNKPVAPNVLRQDFSASKPNQKWVSDITYIQTAEGWLYLCVFIDLYSRMVIGWSMSNRMDSKLVENALAMALFKRKFPSNVIVHSDKGSQYCSRAYQQMLAANKLICSMSSVGCCYDNAACESFFHTLKVEMVNEQRYLTRDMAKTSVVEYIECYYNRKRRHSTINFVSPIELEKMSAFD